MTWSAREAKAAFQELSLNPDNNRIASTEANCFRVKETVPCKREVIVRLGCASVCAVLSIS